MNISSAIYNKALTNCPEKDNIVFSEIINSCNIINLRNLFSKNLFSKKEKLIITCIFSAIVYYFDKNYKNILEYLEIPNDKYKIYDMDGIVFGIFTIGTMKILAIKGSSTLKDFYTDINITYSDENSDIKGKVHNGFYNLLFEKCFSNKKKSRCDLIVDVIKQELKGNVKLILTGHSLGAALSTILLAHIEGMFSNSIELINFGSPRVGDSEFCKSIKCSNITRVVNDDDIITKLPLPFGFRHVGKPYIIGEKGRCQIQPFSIIEHLIKNYFNSIMDLD